MSRFLSLLIGLPVSILLVALAVANRRLVTVSFDPFSANDPALAVQLPLFVVVFAALIVGVVAGGVATWLRQGRFRREAREARRAAKRAAAEDTGVAPSPSSTLSLPAPRA